MNKADGVWVGLALLASGCSGEATGAMSVPSTQPTEVMSPFWLTLYQAGQPIKGAPVAIADAGGALVTDGVTDAAGDYEYADFQAGMTVSVLGPLTGYTPRVYVLHDVPLGHLVLGDPVPRTYLDPPEDDPSESSSVTMTVSGLPQDGSIPWVTRGLVGVDYATILTKPSLRSTTGTALRQHFSPDLAAVQMRSFRDGPEVWNYQRRVHTIPLDGTNVEIQESIDDAHSFLPPPTQVVQHWTDKARPSLTYTPPDVAFDAAGFGLMGSKPDGSFYSFYIMAPPDKTTFGVPQLPPSFAAMIPADGDELRATLLSLFDNDLVTGYAEYLALPDPPGPAWRDTQLPGMEYTELLTEYGFDPLPFGQ
jgi:hypothetical protein